MEGRVADQFRLGDRSRSSSSSSRLRCTRRRRSSALLHDVCAPGARPRRASPGSRRRRARMQPTALSMLACPVMTITSTSGTLPLQALEQLEAAAWPSRGRAARRRGRVGQADLRRRRVLGQRVRCPSLPSGSARASAAAAARRPPPGPGPARPRPASSARRASEGCALHGVPYRCRRTCFRPYRSRIRALEAPGGCPRLRRPPSALPRGRRIRFCANRTFSSSTTKSSIGAPSSASSRAWARTCPRPATPPRQSLSAVSGEPVDLVLADVKMPGINGLELVRQVHDINRPTCPAS